MRVGRWQAGSTNEVAPRNDRSDLGTSEAVRDRRVSRSLFRLSAALAFLALAVAAGLSLAPPRARGDQDAAEDPLAPTAVQTKEFLESGRAKPLVEEPETDLHAAQTMPHQDLDRGEALELAEAVFEPELESLSGIYGQLEPERFLSNYAAVAPVSSLPAESGQPEEGLAAEHPDTPVLVESMLPLRTEGPSGKEEAVDLELEHSEGELQPQNPLAEVGIPGELGEGISLSGSGIELTVAGAPEERSATDAGGEFAFYPEVAEDTDLIVAPTPRGVETMTDIRSAEAPTQTTYDLALPAGAELRATKEGGAEVVEGDRPTLLIPAPTATDAAGNPVKTELTVSGESITVAVTLDVSTAFPILVDPTYINEGWRWTLNRESMAAWSPMSTNWYAIRPIPYEDWQPENQYPGLDLTSGEWGGSSVVGTNASWEYWVPRYKEDVRNFGTAPSSWIYQMSTEGIQFLTWGNHENYPALVAGLVDPVYGWESAAVHYGGSGDLTNWNTSFVYANEFEQIRDKGAAMNLITYQAENPPKRRDTYMADAYISVVDTDAPRILVLNEPAHWVNASPEPILYEFQDEGLGVRSAGVSYQGTPVGTLDLQCSGTTASPCPRLARSTENHLPLPYLPAGLPTGRDYLTVTVGDVMAGLGVAGHTAASNVLVKVDHTAPEVSLSGSLTEQGSVGTHRPTYALRVNAKDGVEGAPQSGVKKVEVLVDGKKIPMAEEAEWEPNCQTQNCALNGEWTMNASEYAAGAHEVKVIATDAVNNVTTKVLQVELHPPAPSLSLSGTMTEQATLGTERPSYSLKINASALAESPTPAAIPAYSSSFGTSGTGNGQFTRPGSMAIDAQGNLWVVDSNDNRLEEFKEGGSYASLIHPEASSKCALSRPTGVAINAAGNLWVTDSGDKRVVELSPAGACLGEFGGAGTAGGKFAGSGPEAIAIDYHGNIWVADTYGGRLEKFSETGVFIRSVATKGKGAEQLGQPDGVAIAPGGNVFVTDWEDDKVAEYGEGGKFIRQFGSQGSEPGQLQNPTGIAVDSRGDVWVPDQNNGRVEEFNQAGEYLGRFGAKGTGAGQFELSYPTGIATDTKGNIWVTDAGDNRVERWFSAGYGSTLMPTYLTSFGSPGTTAGHFSNVLGLAVDGNGNVWAADATNNLLQKFNSKGELLGAYGKAGSGNGELSAPTALTANAGHIWDVEMSNARAQEFNESGVYLSKFGQYGTTAGLIQYPWGIAIDAGHHVWVTETGANPVQEFSETGTFIKQLGKSGSGIGEFNGATGIAIGPGGKLWIVDNGNNRVEEFSESGTFIRQFGGKESEVGHLSSPMGIYVDHNEHVWVVDRGHDRVVEFNGQGEYIGQFGSTGPGQLTSPQLITGDQSGHLFVGDDGSNKVEEWSEPTLHSQISTEITVDGKRVEVGETSCATETCAAVKEWTLQSSGLTPGSHEVLVRATDGLGNTTTKAMTIKVGDTTKPTLELRGALATAPEGWIGQSKGSYGLLAFAKDTGFGVTSLNFVVDGKTLKSKTQTCPEGGCEGSFVYSFHANEFEGGAHQAELIITDGAGNSTKKSWTINVDPEGAVTSDEAEATVEALEETSGPQSLVVLPQPGEGPQVESPQDGTIEITETNVPVSVAQDPSAGTELEIADRFLLSPGCRELAGEPDMGGGEAAEREMEETGSSREPSACTPEQEAEWRHKMEEEQQAEEKRVAAGEKEVGLQPITVSPAAISSSAGNMTPVEGAATIAPNTHQGVDTIFRPMSAGGYSFEDIRSPESPEHYAYELNLSPELALVQVSPQEVAVVYKEGGPVAFTMTALPAYDAIGSSVPTHLAVSGPAMVTLTVEHRAPSPVGGAFVYPVAAGAGWEGGYRTISFEMNEPPPPTQEEEEHGTVSEDGARVRTRVNVVGPAIADSLTQSPEHFFSFSECLNDAAKYKWMKEQIESAGTRDVDYAATLVGNCAREMPPSEGERAWRGDSVRGWAHVNSTGQVWVEQSRAGQLECKKWGVEPQAMVHCYVHPQKALAITVGGDFRTAAGSWFPRASECTTIYGILRSEKPHAIAEEAIESQAGEGEPCHWPAE
jgi:sugar lactone lactonase YvrE